MRDGDKVQGAEIFAIPFEVWEDYEAVGGRRVFE